MVWIFFCYFVCGCFAHLPVHVVLSTELLCVMGDFANRTVRFHARFAATTNDYARW